MAEAISAIARLTMKMKQLAISQPQTIPTGPAGIEKERVDAIEGRRPMMLKATAKIWTVE
jgi:hypothetical protein